MLQTMRDGLVGWVAWLFVILIGLPFAILGITDFGSTAQELVVAEVDDLVVEQRDYQQRFQNRRQNIQRQLGGNYQPDKFDQVIQKQVLDSMIEEKLLARLAENNNLQTGDDELSLVIKHDPVFMKDGKFDFEHYKAQIGRAGFTVSSYEEFLRKERTLSVIPRLITSSSFITDQQAKRYNRLLQQQRQVSYVIVGKQNFKKEAVVSEQDARDYYESHTEQFVRPEQVKLEYVRVSAEKLADRIDASEEAIRKFYDENSDRYVTEEQRKASHILLGLPEGKDLEGSPEVSAKIEEIRKKLAAGEKFEDLARQYSEDPGSATAGGDLGQVIRGVMVPSFEDALFALKEINQISDPVRTSFGIHLIRLDGITDQKVKRYDEVKDQLKENYASEQAVNLFYDLSERMAELSYEHPDSLQTVSEAVAVPLQTTEWLARNNNLAGISGNQDILKAAFSSRLKTSGSNSDPIEVGVNDALVFRVQEVRESTTIPYDEISDRVMAAAQSEKNNNQVRDYAEKLVERIRQGESLEVLSKSENLVFESPELLKRGAGKLPAELTRKIFKMQAPKNDQPTIDSIPLADGRQAIVLLKQVIEPADGQADSKSIIELSRRMASKEADNFLSEIRSNAKVVIYKDKL